MFAAAAMRTRGGALSAAMTVLLSACASLSPAKVPPPPGYEQTTAASPVTRASQPASQMPTYALQLPPPTSKAQSQLPAPTGFATSQARRLTATSAEPPIAPVIYLAPDAPRITSPIAMGSPRVMQADPGPALALDYKPNPAWKSAVIPPNSPAATVGRVSPPATPGFTIGAGDTVQIDVLGRNELSAKGNVSGDGRVNVALVGAVNIGGLTPVQAADRIARAYKDGQYLVSPQVTVTMVDYQSQLLTVLGEVRTPGRFPMRTRLSVLDGLALSGGITEQGASMAYLLRPEDSVVTRYEIDLEALIQAGAGQQYFELLAGDTLVVPKTQVFYVYGEVKTPNAYKLKPGMTVIQALSLAGGLTDKGSDRRIDIRRRDADGRLRTLSASLNEPLQADDVMYIRERLF